MCTCVRVCVCVCVCVCECVCVCVCVCERERERERGREGGREVETERERQRELNALRLGKKSSVYSYLLWSVILPLASSDSTKSQEICQGIFSDSLEVCC